MDRRSGVGLSERGGDSCHRRDGCRGPGRGTTFPLTRRMSMPTRSTWGWPHFRRWRTSPVSTIHLIRAGRRQYRLKVDLWDRIDRHAAAAHSHADRSVVGTVRTPVSGNSRSKKRRPTEAGRRLFYRQSRYLGLPNPDPINGKPVSGSRSWMERPVAGSVMESATIASQHLVSA